MTSLLTLLSFRYGDYRLSGKVTGNKYRILRSGGGRWQLFCNKTRMNDLASSKRIAITRLEMMELEAGRVIAPNQDS